MGSIALDPPVHGNRARNRALVQALRTAGHRIHYLRWSDSATEPDPIEAMRSLVDESCFLRARATRLERRYLRTARQLALRLPRPLWWPLARDRFRSHLCPRALLQETERILRGRRYAAVIADYANLGPIAALARRHGALGIIDTHDLLWQRADAIRRERVFPTGTIIDAAQETAMLREADLVVAIQPREAEWLRGELDPSRVLLVEHGIELPDAEPYPAAAPPVLTLVASDNKQNQHGLAWFIAEAWPRVLAELPRATLRVHGPLSTHRACRGPRVDACGIAEGLGRVYREATVLLNPIRAGSGLKIKSVEAMAHGRALVTTPTGADGLLPEASDAIVVADGAAAFAHGCVGLLRDPARAAAMALRGRRLCEARFSAERVFQPLIDVIAARASAKDRTATRPA